MDKETKRKQKVEQALKDKKIVDDTSFTVFQMVEDLKEDLDEKIKELQKEQSVDAKVERVAMKLAAKLAYLEKGDKGDKPTEEELREIIEPLIPEPIKGDSYILTDEDKAEIALSIAVPVVEKETVVEKTTEVIRETPIVTENVVEKAMYEEPNQIVAKINVATDLIDNNKIKGFSDLERISKMNAFNPTMGPSFSDIIKKQDKLIAGANITITGNTISANESAAGTLADISTNSTTTPNSLYTMTSTIPVNFQRSGGASLLYLDETNGRVGIGTTGPGYPLDVVGNVHASNQFIAGGSLSTGGNLDFTGGPSIIHTSYYSLAGTGLSVQWAAANTVASGQTTQFAITPTYNQSGTTANTDFLINRTETSVGSGAQRLFDAQVGGTSKMVILNTGNVGIGTVSPGNNLTINTAAADTLPALGANGGKLGITNAGLYGLLGGVLSSGNAYLQVQRVDTTATAYNLLLQPNGGNVGIGTTTPTNKLSVNGNTDIQGNLAIGLTTASQGSIEVNGSNAGFAFGDTNGKTKFFTSGGITYFQNGAAYTSDSRADLRFTSMFGATTFMTVQGSSGNVGIGLTSPTAVLHLKAGTASANSAPLKFTSGTLLTTAEAGAVEFLTDAYYGTITTGAARKTFAFLESPTFTGTVTAPTIISTATITLKGYTVAGLPAGTVGMTAYVTDALAPTFLATIVGGGAVTTPVFYNGSNWVSY